MVYLQDMLRKEFVSTVALAGLMLVANGCAQSRKPAAGLAQDLNTAPLQLTPADETPTTRILIRGPTAIGPMGLWVPEGIMCETGACSVYPVGQPWQRQGTGVLEQSVGPAGNFGPGNVRLVDDRTVDLAGVRLSRESPVAFKTVVEARGRDVVFTIRLTNAGDRPIRKAGAAICLKFLEAGWWSDEHTFVISRGKIRSLAQLGRNVGPGRDFEAYLLNGETFDNVFYHQFWGFNASRLDEPVMVAENRAAGLCVRISADRAYFLHSNRGNPCTDIMLAFATVEPGQSAEATGRVSIRAGRANDWLASEPAKEFP